MLNSYCEEMFKEGAVPSKDYPCTRTPLERSHANVTLKMSPLETSIYSLVKQSNIRDPNFIRSEMDLFQVTIFLRVPRQKFVPPSLQVQGKYQNIGWVFRVKNIKITMVLSEFPSIKPLELTKSNYPTEFTWYKYLEHRKLWSLMLCVSLWLR